MRAVARGQSRCTPWRWKWAIGPRTIIDTRRVPCSASEHYSRARSREDCSAIIGASAQRQAKKQKRVRKIRSLPARRQTWACSLQRRRAVEMRGDVLIAKAPLGTRRFSLQCNPAGCQWMRTVPDSPPLDRRIRQQHRYSTAQHCTGTDMVLVPRYLGHELQVK
jgi:hypothetical protein